MEGCGFQQKTVPLFFQNKILIQKNEIRLKNNIFENEDKKNHRFAVGNGIFRAGNSAETEIDEESGSTEARRSRGNACPTALQGDAARNGESDVHRQRGS